MDRTVEGKAAREAPEAQRLLERVRRRLWGIAVAKPAAIVASLSAAGLMVGALCHLLVGRHSPLLPFVLAIALNLGSLVVIAALRRPSLGAAAQAADHWFGGEALLTSALDQLRRPISMRRGGAPFVLARAEKRALQWLPELAERAPRPAKGLVVFALAGSILAGLFYSLPGAALNASLRSSGSLVKEQGAGDSLVSEAGSMARRSEWGFEGAPFSRVARSIDSAAAGGGSFTPAETASRGDVHAGMGSRGASSTGAGGPSAGSAEPRLGVAATDSNASEFSVDFVELEDRPELGEDGAGSTGLEFDALQGQAQRALSADLAAGLIPSATSPAASAARLSISPILRHFVVTYQEQIQALE